MSSAECGTDNLIANRMPQRAARTSAATCAWSTDGQAAPEGAQWDAPGRRVPGHARRLADLRPRVGAVGVGVRAAGRRQRQLQDFGATEDTPSAYKLLIEVDSVVNVGHGLRTRPVRIEPTAVRYVRIGEPLGDSSYSISEFQAYCTAPNPFPPKLPVVDAPAAEGRRGALVRVQVVRQRRERALRDGAGVGRAGAAGLGHLARQAGAVSPHGRLRDGLLVFIGVVSFPCYFNFGFWHFPNCVHQWDTFHYYVGSKYFKELSYDRLYECVAVADSEAPGLRRRVELRKVMNLRTNMMEGTQQILAHPEDVQGPLHARSAGKTSRRTSPTSAASTTSSAGRRRRPTTATTATPVWNVMGTMLANTGAGLDEQIDWLTWIDPLFILGLTLLSVWAFGWRTTCVALAVFATNFPSRFYWTGGAFLRWDWLFYFVEGSAW